MHKNEGKVDVLDNGNLYSLFYGNNKVSLIQNLVIYLLHLHADN